MGLEFTPGFIPDDDSLGLLHSTYSTMALPMLMNGGAECGPSNPLQGLSKQFDQDRSAAQVSIAATSVTSKPMISCVSHECRTTLDRELLNLEM